MHLMELRPRNPIGFFCALATSLLVVASSPARALDETGGTTDLVSYSFDEGTLLQYEHTHPDHVQDTVFAPSNNWFPTIRFLGDGNGSEIEVDALSYGHSAASSQTDAFFSVGPQADGLPGTAVAGQVLADREADLFASNFSGTNTQIYDANGSNGAPNMGLAEPASTNVDGLDMRASSPEGVLYWSVSRQTAENANPYAPIIASGADIFLGVPANGYSVTNPPQHYAHALDLGLTETDDVDALVVIEVKNDGVFDPSEDTIYYSLVIGSTSLVVAGVPPFDTAAGGDVFLVGGGSPAVGLAFSAQSVGLDANDDLDALDFAIRADILTALAAASTSVPIGDAVALGLAGLLVASGVARQIRRFRS